jgi:hypothetical protein
MLWLLDKVTTTVGSCAREDGEQGLEVSMELNKDLRLSSSINEEDLHKCGKRAHKLVGQNPYAGVYESIIECSVCGPQYSRHSYQLEYSVSLSLQSEKLSSLEDLIQHHFTSEVIQDFTCLRCSVLKYLPIA